MKIQRAPKKRRDVPDVTFLRSSSVGTTALADGSVTEAKLHADVVAQLGGGGAGGSTGITAADVRVLHDWRLDEASGTSFSNYGSSTEALATTGTPFVGRIGPLGRGVEFKNIAEDSLVGAATVEPDRALFAAEAWVWMNRRSLPGAWAHIVGKGANSTWATPFITFNMGVSNDGTGRLLWQMSHGATIRDLHADTHRGGELLAGAINHVVGSWDGSTVRLYVNGRLAQETNYGALGAINTSTQPYYVGGRHTKDGEPWTGLIQRVRIHSGTIRSEAYWRDQWAAVMGWK